MRARVHILMLVGVGFLLGACADKHPEPPRGGRGGPPPGMADMDMERHGDRMDAAYRDYVERFDYNRDGFATCDDIRLQRSRLFRLLDEDKDGKLVSGEYRHAKFEDKSFLFFDFRRVDTNGSGAVELEELEAIPHSQFLGADKDGDCTISREEALMAMRETKMEGEGPGGRGKGGPGGKGGRGGPPPGGGGGMGGPMMTGD